MTRSDFVSGDPLTQGMLDRDQTFAGFHQFTSPLGPYGSFEVSGVWPHPRNTLDTGWYWQACFPGCLPDGELSGPFPTAEGAYLDAIGE